MESGRPNINRGHQLEGAPIAPLRLARGCQPRADAQVEPVAPSSLMLSPEYHLVHDRLSALERLTRLFEQGALSAEEFAAEKARILNLPAEERVLHAPPPHAPAAPTPSLLGRLFGWKVLPVGLAAGLGLSYATQPRETVRIFEESLRLFGL